MNIEDPQVSAILPRLEVAVFAHLCCSATFAFSVRRINNTLGKFETVRLQQATAVDLLEHLKFAADNFLPKCTSASFALQKRCLVRLLAFLHCTSFIDCRKDSFKLMIERFLIFRQVFLWSPSSCFHSVAHQMESAQC